jgi:hypothetical protein
VHLSRWTAASWWTYLPGFGGRASLNATYARSKKLLLACFSWWAPLRERSWCSCFGCLAVDCGELWYNLSVSTMLRITKSKAHLPSCRTYKEPRDLEESVHKSR